MKIKLSLTILVAAIAPLAVYAFYVSSVPKKDLTSIPLSVSMDKLSMKYSECDAALVKILSSDRITKNDKERIYYKQKDVIHSLSTVCDVASNANIEYCMVSKLHDNLIDLRREYKVLTKK